MRRARSAAPVAVLLVLVAACSVGKGAGQAPTTSPSSAPTAPTTSPTSAPSTAPTTAPTTAAPTCGGARPRRPTGGTYECTFTDGFQGTTIDSQKWIAQGTWFSGMTNQRHDCFVDSPDNLSQSGGALHVTARLVDQPFVCSSPYGNFLSQGTIAALATRNHFAQTYGRFEFRARFPRSVVPGLHSALWAYPAAHTYGAWPKSGEIDVAEWWSARYTYVIPSVHYEGEPAPSSSGRCIVAGPWRWHRYAVEWTPTYMRFLYDGVECFRHTWTPAAPLVPPQPFDQPFYLVVTQGFGADWNAVTPQTPRVATMDVDWVRAWE